MMLEESALPVPGDVAAACEMLGLDPLYVANEGVLVAIVAAEQAERGARGAAGPSAGTGRRDPRTGRG